MLVVADTSALVALAACDALTLLDRLFQEVRVPLYKHLNADSLLVDDHRARKVARLNGIEVVGSLGILIRAKESGLVSKIRPLLATIQAAGVHYSEPLVDEALHLAGERG